jgi:large subunit ribosomal protein L9
MATPIRVVLKQDVKDLGKGGDVVRVRPGFARNYLIPRSLAAVASGGNLAQIEEIKRAALARAAKERTGAEQLGTKISQVSVKIERAVGAENKMYGSVTAKDIEDAYAAQGIEIDRRKVQLDEPIRTLGLHEVVVRLHSDVTANLRVEVVKQS